MTAGDLVTVVPIAMSSLAIWVSVATLRQSHRNAEAWERWKRERWQQDTIRRG